MNEIKVRGLDGQETLFRVDLDTITAGQLKQQIHDKLTIAVDGQRLLFGGQILDDARTLESYNIGDGFVIRLLFSVPPPYTPTNAGSSTTSVAPTAVLRTVFVASPLSGGRTTGFQNVPVNTTIKSFKDMIAERTGDDPETIFLIYAGKQFEDRRNNTVMTLADYGVGNDNTIQMVLRLPGGW